MWLDDAEDVPCGRCGTDVHLQHHGPCPHGQAACHGCGWELVCEECRKRAELDALDEVPC